MADDSPVSRSRRVLHDAIAQLPGIDEDLFDGSYLVGWVVVAEFAVPDGGRTLAPYSGADGGEADVLPWQATGYLQHAIAKGMFDATLLLEFDPESDDESEEDD